MNGLTNSHGGRTMSGGILQSAARALVVAIGVVVGGALISGTAVAQCTNCGCVYDAAAKTTEAVNDFTASAITQAVQAITVALQGTAAQISANIRGILAPLGTMFEGLSAQDTERLMQSDRVNALHAYQFSSPLCVVATSNAISAAAATVAQTTQIMAGMSNQKRTAGTDGVADLTKPIAAKNERATLFCDPNDPVCNGNTGTRPGADRNPGSVLAIGGLRDEMDLKQAAWVTNNLTQPIPAVKMTKQQATAPGGVDKYMQRGGDETKMNLAKDVTTDIMVTRRLPTIDNTQYNALATAAQLPTISGNVSQEEMDRMNYRDSAAGYEASLTSLDQAALTRQVAVLEKTRIQQAYYQTTVMEKIALLMASLVSVLEDPRLQANSGAAQ